MLKSRRIGGSAAYPPSENYLLNPVSSQTLKGGSACNACNTGGGRRYGGFFADASKANVSATTGHDSAHAAEAAVHKGGARRRQRGGAPVELTAFISALALLGARLLADKNSSFNFFSNDREEPSGLYKEDKEDQVGGRRRRPAAKKAAPTKRRPAAKKAAPKRRPAAPM